MKYTKPETREAIADMNGLFMTSPAPGTPGAPGGNDTVSDDGDLD